MKLKQLRKEKGLNQENVSTALNLSRTAYNYYENERREPNIDTLIKLADYFGTTIDNLVGHEVPYLIDKSQFSDTQLNIIDAIKQLPEDTCKRIEAYVMGALMAENERKATIEMFRKREDNRND